MKSLLSLHLRPPLSPESIPALDDDALRKLVESIPGGQDIDRKRALFDLLDAEYKFPLPKRMIDDEFREIWRGLMIDRRAGRLDREDLHKSERQLRSEYRAIAERRVRLGYILAAIWRRSGLADKEFPWGAPPPEIIETRTVDFIFALSTSGHAAIADQR